MFRSSAHDVGTEHCWRKTKISVRRPLFEATAVNKTGIALIRMSSVTSSLLHQKIRHCRH